MPRCSLAAPAQPLEDDKKRRNSAARADAKRQRRAEKPITDTDDAETRNKKLLLVKDYGIGFEDDQLCQRAARNEPLMCLLAAAATAHEVQNWFNLLAFRADVDRQFASEGSAAERRGASAAAETLLGIAAIELTVGLDALLALASHSEQRTLIVDSIKEQVRVRSPVDASVYLSADEFFALVAARGIYRGGDALLPGGVATSVRYKGILLEPGGPYTIPLLRICHA